MHKLISTYLTEGVSRDSSQLKNQEVEAKHYSEYKHDPNREYMEMLEKLWLCPQGSKTGYGVRTFTSHFITFHTMYYFYIFFNR